MTIKLIQISIVFCWLGMCNTLMEIWKFLFKMGNCEEKLPKKSVSQLLANRLPTGNQQATDS